MTDSWLHPYWDWNSTKSPKRYLGVQSLGLTKTVLNWTRKRLKIIMSNSSDQVCLTLQLAINKPVKGFFVHYTVLVDIAPCILHTQSGFLVSLRHSGSHWALEVRRMQFSVPTTTESLSLDSRLHPVRLRIVRSSREQHHSQLFDCRQGGLHGSETFERTLFVHNISRVENSRPPEHGIGCNE